MVEVKTFGDGSDLQLIHGYGDGGFRVSQERYAGHLFLLPREASVWQPPTNIDDLAATDLLPLMGDAPPPLLILGRRRGAHASVFGAWRGASRTRGRLRGSVHRRGLPDMERVDERGAGRCRGACRPAMSAGWQALRATDRDLALALLFAPGASRELIADRMSLAIEAETALKLASEPMLAAIRLQWWVETIEQGSGGSVPLMQRLQRHLDSGAATPVALASQMGIWQDSLPRPRKPILKPS